jgi:ABC-type Mn2+/Zn2+ transport system permease subunit
MATPAAIAAHWRHRYQRLLAASVDFANICGAAFGIGS